jgi:hypothetical protein
MEKKSSELLMVMQKENFLRTVFNQLHHQMQREKLFNLHEIANFIAPLFVLKTYEILSD